MVRSLIGEWEKTIKLTRASYDCGYCGSKVGPSDGYSCYKPNYPGKTLVGNIYICPNCNKPTFKELSSSYQQVPGQKFGNEVEHLPPDIESLYNEARNCISINAYNSAVLACRKLLMNIGHTKGAKAGERFIYYVDYLNDNHFIPPNGKEWVDHIRKKGNEATHEIPSMTRLDAIELIDFTEMLLRFVYELPGRMERHKRT
ncbi:DUF4145 domain-containing protein [Bacillus sp. Au-Bac7]|uniref:DUF4145 domain-containing protein n=1 Tax=Bacillus sp. Au-Bac7 TaxID=2906458 RepID=UPI001E44B411|nr:DUF4145 domain-containing protein [Bacillus sp. Au-Bac7]MCE4052013.1 DUF4145 domain-containing protein [Bacillus sp. Au-Bac7]